MVYMWACVSECLDLVDDPRANVDLQCNCNVENTRSHNTSCLECSHRSCQNCGMYTLPAPGDS
jgi:ribosomal protein L32